jgi:uracil-DNA glycosylase
MDLQIDTEYDPAEVVKIVAQALQDQSILPFSFIETTIFERLSVLLARYMSAQDVTWMISELKHDFFSGFTKLNPQKLHSIIKHCVKCGNLVQDAPLMPSWNVIDPDLMILVSNPTAVKQHTALLTSSLKQAGFSSQRCVLTYVSRCPLVKPDPTVVKNCLPYLHTEIAILNPKLIMPLGQAAYAALTGDQSSKFADVKGTVHWMGPYAILPEASLASLVFTQEKTQSLQSYLLSTMNTAFSFLYGGH